MDLLKRWHAEVWHGYMHGQKDKQTFLPHNCTQLIVVWKNKKDNIITITKQTDYINSIEKNKYWLTQNVRWFVCTRKGISASDFIKFLGKLLSWTA